MQTQTFVAEVLGKQVTVVVTENAIHLVQRDGTTITMDEMYKLAERPWAPHELQKLADRKVR